MVHQWSVGRQEVEELFTKQVVAGLVAFTLFHEGCRALTADLALVVG